MNKKENRMAVRQEVQKSVIRDEQNRRIQFAATNPINEVLKNLHTTLRGLDEDAISVSRAKAAGKLHLLMANNPIFLITRADEAEKSV